jgi:hypothetical protein
MSSRRRTVLAAIGSTAVFGGGIGYWNRRRIHRRDEINDINNALKIELQSVDPPLFISEEHLQSSYHRARDHISKTESLLNTADNVSHGTKLNRAQEELNAYPPEEIVDSNNRINALEAYRLAVAISGGARARAYGDVSGSPSDALRNALDALQTELDAVEPQYYGSSLSTVVVQCGEADELYSTAVSQANRAQNHITDDEFSNAVTWEIAEQTRQIIHDSSWLFEEREGPDQTDALKATFERLTDQIKKNINNVTMHYEDGVWSQARGRLLDLKMRTSDSKTQLNAGRVALAVRDQAIITMTTATFDILEQYPAIQELNGTVYRLTDNSDQLIAEKQDASEAITATVTAVGDNRLGRCLLTEVIKTADRADRQLNRLLDNVRSYDQKQWLSGRDSVYLRYRSSAAEVRAIPDVVALVEA